MLSVLVNTHIYTRMSLFVLLTRKVDDWGFFGGGHFVEMFFSSQQLK
jgi:hypothetical protein